MRVTIHANKKLLLVFFSISILAQFAVLAQAGGNIIYSTPKAQAATTAPGDLSVAEPKGSVPVSFVEANVLLNLKPDAYQAVFALAQEGQTVAEANEKLTTQANEFVQGLKKLGAKDADTFVDFVSQNRIYDFNVEGNVAREKLSGFEVKKNIIVRYQNPALLDKMLESAAKSSIFDLVKVDYIITDIPAAKARLLEEASKIIRTKEASYTRLFHVKLGHASVYQEKYSSYFPSDMYKSYTAYESANAESYNMRVVRSRKVSTSYYSPLDPSGFDAVINPGGVEPGVQFTLYLKVGYR